MTLRRLIRCSLGVASSSVVFDRDLRILQCRLIRCAGYTLFCINEIRVFEINFFIKALQLEYHNQVPPNQNHHNYFIIDKIT